MMTNTVPAPASGLIIALQFYAGDADRAFRLARLMADIEERQREDVLLAFCPRFDFPRDDSRLLETIHYCSKKVPVTMAGSDRRGTGHPDGPNALWAGVMEKLADRWQRGVLSGRSSVFTCEPDGVPLCKRWIDVLAAAHEASLRSGKRVTGSLSGMFTDGQQQLPHLNGSLIMHLSFWLDHPSIHRTPAGEAWDLYGAPAIMTEARATTEIRNPYGCQKMSDEVLKALGNEVAWCSSVKDASAIDWAERTLVTR